MAFSPYNLHARHIAAITAAAAVFALSLAVMTGQGDGAVASRVAVLMVVGVAVAFECTLRVVTRDVPA